MKKIRITECVHIDMEREMFQCGHCGFDLISARDHYLKGCLVYERPAGEIYGPSITLTEGQSVDYAPDPDFVRPLEFYCPDCGGLIEVQYLPPGHPIPVDIELDIDKLKEKYIKGL